jgi:Uma2 family endonuclease
VIEVVSPGTESTDNDKRDYEQKPSEYAERDIPEMWLIDPDDLRSVADHRTLAGKELNARHGRCVLQVQIATKLTHGTDDG